MGTEVALVPEQLNPEHLVPHQLVPKNFLKFKLLFG